MAKKPKQVPTTKGSDINRSPSKSASPADEAAAKVDRAIAKAAREEAECEADFHSTAVTLHRELCSRGLIADNGTSFAGMMKLLEEMRSVALKATIEAVAAKNKMEVSTESANVRVNPTMNRELLKVALDLSINFVENRKKELAREDKQRKQVMGD